tara:strand:- start:505 stop:828 length:324 start_codon:yes stop_codon:yes gene_type:complete
MFFRKPRSKLLQELEQISILYPKRIARLKGYIQTKNNQTEKLIVIIFKGFASCITHPTEADPDASILPSNAHLIEGEILEGPMNPLSEKILWEKIEPNKLKDKKYWQ